MWKGDGRRRRSNLRIGHQGSMFAQGHRRLCIQFPRYPFWLRRVNNNRGLGRWIGGGRWNDGPTLVTILPRSWDHCADLIAGKYTETVLDVSWAAMDCVKLNRIKVNTNGVNHPWKSATFAIVDFRCFLILDSCCSRERVKYSYR